MPDGDNESRMSSARRDKGMVVVLASVSEGPNAGAKIVSMTPREDLVHAVRHVRAKNRGERRHLLRSIARTVVAGVAVSISEISPANDADLMADLVILMAFAIVEGRRVLTRTGLHDIKLAIEEDETLPWHRRGMLDPEMEMELGLDTTVTRIH